MVMSCGRTRLQARLLQRPPDPHLVYPVQGVEPALVVVLRRESSQGVGDQAITSAAFHFRNWGVAQVARRGQTLGEMEAGCVPAQGLHPPGFWVQAAGFAMCPHAKSVPRARRRMRPSPWGDLSQASMPASSTQARPAPRSRAKAPTPSTLWVP